MNAAGRWLLTRALPPAVVLVGAAAVLEVVLRVEGVPAYLMPRPSAVVQALTTGPDRDSLLAALWVTTKATLIGLAASAAAGMAAAVALSASPLVRRAVYPYTVFFQTVPIVVIAPMLVIWLDPGLASVATCAFIVSVFPVIANTLAGLLSTDPALVDLFRLYGAGPVAALFKLRLPSALPDVITGLRVAAGLAVIGSVVADFQVGRLVDEAGLGMRIVGANHNGKTAVAFAGALLASALGLALFGAVNLLGRLLLRHWHASQRN